MSRRQRQLLTCHVDVLASVTIEEQISSEVRVVIRVVRCNEQILRDFEACFDLAALQLRSGSVGQEAAIRGDHQIVEVESKSLRLVGRPSTAVPLSPTSYILAVS